MTQHIACTRLDAYQDAPGAVVVIDVIRAFTTAAFAFAGGAREIVLVAGVDEALALRARMPGALVMGEVGGLPPAGFDFGNSPAAMARADVRGRRLIQRTGSGTQGAVRCRAAPMLLASSFVCARATLAYLRQAWASAVTFVATAHDRGDEDMACAEYLAAHLSGRALDVAPFLQRTRDCDAARAFLDPNVPAFDAEDIALCTQADRFDFAMVVDIRDGLLVMTAHDPIRSRAEASGAEPML